MFVAFEVEHMSAVARFALIVLLLGTLHLVLTPHVRGEIVEEMIAWVDGDIITKSDLERQESDLLDIIDHKILHHRGQQLWGAKEIEESYYRDFLQQQGLSEGEELEKLLAQESLTVEDLKHLLSEKHVPDQVIEHEVTVLMPGISDLEVRDYYNRHPEKFMAPTQVESRSEERLIPFDESIDRAREALQNERFAGQLEAFIEMARGEAEWWVKAEYRDRLPEGVKPTREELPLVVLPHLREAGPSPTPPK